MAETAVNALDNEQGNQDVKNVLKWLFLKDDDNSDPIVLRDVRSSLTGISTMSAEVTTGQPGWTDVKVYCDMGRFEGNQRDDGRWYDPDIEEVIDPKGTSDVDWQDCKDFLPTTFAYTHNPRGQKFSQVQICPWFLGWAKGKEFNSWEDVQTKAKVFNWAVPKLTSGWPLTAIDAASLFDKVLLHELTHTRSGGSTTDVGGGSNPLFGGARYGWRECKSLAQKGADPNDRDQAPQRNADSIALLGSAMRFLHLEENPKRVKENGAMEEITPNPSKNKRWPDLVDPMFSLDKRFAEPGRFIKVVKAGAVL
ncbi:hypothetical protein MPH_11293 [Macrophomina phaseolina MS6]|uniref:Lysine-specific metallo-endopeptidase domain-containing protein n=2 Tax=Macrophomina phaseolina TaxID=35725 RepID=K2RFX6_MACPH|nr:hypothetical protein MPH_11293 [Macrophomina phaseolina MS6]